MTMTRKSPSLKQPTVNNHHIRERKSPPTKPPYLGERWGGGTTTHNQHIKRGKKIEQSDQIRLFGDRIMTLLKGGIKQ